MTREPGLFGERARLQKARPNRIVLNHIGVSEHPVMRRLGIPGVIEGEISIGAVGIIIEGIVNEILGEAHLFPRSQKNRQDNALYRGEVEPVDETVGIKGIDEFVELPVLFVDPLELLSDSPFEKSEPASLLAALHERSGFRDKLRCIGEALLLKSDLDELNESIEGRLLVYRKLEIGPSLYGSARQPAGNGESN